MGEHLGAYTDAPIKAECEAEHQHRGNHSLPNLFTFLRLLELCRLENL